MFKIHFKLFKILALISMIIGISFLVLVVFQIVKSDDLISIFNLSALIFLLLAAALYIHPKMKLFKIKNKYIDKYRLDLYKLILTDSSRNKIDITKVTFNENNGYLEFSPLKKKETLIFDDLTLKEATVVTLDLMREFAYVTYAKLPEKKTNRLVKDATIDSFEVSYIYSDGIQSKFFIENGKFVNMK